jgi:acryloyl-coenzyme A reductase
VKAIVAARPGSASELVWTEVPEPLPGPLDCLIKVEACGVCMHDVLVRTARRQAGVDFPVILGHEVIGTVVRVGSLVTNIAVGQRVVTVQREFVCGECRECRSGHESKCASRRFLGDSGLNGGYAELVRISAASIVSVPGSSPSPDLAVAACTIGTGLNAIRDVGNLRLGESVLITGAGGGVGLHAVQLARAAGALVIAVTSAQVKADVIKAAGADRVLVAARGTDFSKQVDDATKGRGCDLVIENVGSSTLPFSIRSVTNFGRVVLVGEMAWRPVDLDLVDLRARNVALFSASGTSRAQLQDVMELIERRLVRPCVDVRLPMQEAARAHELIESGQVAGRILLCNEDSNASVRSEDGQE